METKNIHYAKTHLSALLEEVQGGKRIIIAKAGKPVALLSPVQETQELRKPGALKGKITIASNFDTLPTAFLKHFSLPR